MRPSDLTFEAIEPWIEIRADRSGGPGGQHVNKVSTQVTLVFDFQSCQVLSERQKRIIARALATRVGRDGRLRVRSRRHRSQNANRRAAGVRLVELLRGVLTPRPKRLPTRPTQASRRRRLDEKRRRGETKRRRAWRADNDW